MMPRWWPHARAARSAALALAAASGCTGLFGFDDLRPAPADAGAPACSHRTPPARPGVADAGGALDLVFATSKVDFGDSDDPSGSPRYRSIGYDLDDTCTGEGQGPSCVEAISASTVNHDDGIDGIDNASGQLLYDSNKAQLGSATTFAQTAAETLIVRVQGYSGTADDDAVVVSLYTGLAVQPRPDGTAAPLWDGKDRWLLDPSMMTASGSGALAPRFRDSSAYVIGWVLVVRLADASGPNALTQSNMAVKGFVMTARLVPVGTGWELRDGVNASRMRLSDALATMGRAPSPRLSSTEAGPPTPICASPVLYNLFKQRICSYADISWGPDSPSSPCDALSLAAAFEAKQAQLGDLGPEPPPPPACAPGVTPDNDSCSSL